MRNLKVILEYDGTPYFGFQYQAALPTVQATIEEAWGRVLREPVKVTAAGRTDTGVHAEGQVVNFYTSSPIPLAHCAAALNSGLPPTIHVREIEEVPLPFNARFSARLRSYRYRLAEGFRAAPLRRGFVAYFPQKLDVRILKDAASVFEGKHNFFAFCGGGIPAEAAWKTVLRTDATHDNGITTLHFDAPSFLPKMVRMMVGAVVEVSRGVITKEAVRGLLERACEKFNRVAPPQGLALAAVRYDEVAR